MNWETGEEDGSGWGGHAPTAAERREERRAKKAEQPLMFQAAVSGLWYLNPDACGEISAIKHRNVIYERLQNIH